MDSATDFWFKRSSYAAHAVLQTGCVANEVATKFIVFGPSEVRALPVRRCRQAAWQTKWPLNSLFFSPPLPLPPLPLPPTYYFSPRRGFLRVVEKYFVHFLG